VNPTHVPDSDQSRQTSCTWRYHTAVKTHRCLSHSAHSSPVLTVRAPKKNSDIKALPMLAQNHTKAHICHFSPKQLIRSAQKAVVRWNNRGFFLASKLQRWQITQHLTGADDKTRLRGSSLRCRVAQLNLLFNVEHTHPPTPPPHPMHYQPAGRMKALYEQCTAARV
jgi:hypothetical protein